MLLVSWAVLGLATSCRHTSAAHDEAGDPARAFDWRAPEGHGHPLVGRIWDTRGQTFVTESQLIDRVAATRNVLLGEIHDNEDHHRLQARVIRRRAEKTALSPGRLVVEMLTLDQQIAVDAALQAHPGDADALGRAVEWDQSGWPSWSMYRPVFEAALQAGLEVRAANLSRADAMKISAHEMEIDANLAHRHRLNEPLPGPLEASLVRELIEGHCNMLPQFMIPPMIQIQRLRDALMADAIIAPDAPRSSVLIAGLGHVRTDRGVPYYLRMAQASSISIGFIEVQDDQTEPSQYATVPESADSAAFDVLWFTARRADRDHCAELRERFKKPDLPPRPREQPTQ
ncbi:MAG: ChaN family lipoprotein [Deltaproteobacteria bacterium]|nr:ChaN family lipoprotein [Deltaproteobacteria bacterium]